MLAFSRSVNPTGLPKGSHGDFMSIKNCNGYLEETTWYATVLLHEYTYVFILGGHTTSHGNKH